MSAELNHTIVWVSDKQRSASFLNQMFGLPEPTPYSRFLVVPTGNGVSMDYADREGPITPQHYAFLVSEAEFDAVMERIKARGLQYWADPTQKIEGQINTQDGGRGVYFKDPDGHLLEALTRPYGSGDDS